MNRKSGYLLVTTLMLGSALLSACGSGGNEKNASSASPSAAAGSTQAAASESASPSAAQEDTTPVTIKYASWMSKGEDKPMLEAFMKKYPYITVEDTVLDGAQYDKLLKTKIISGDAPDVFLFMKAAQYASYVQEGWLMDVTDEPGTARLKESQPLADYYSVDGKIYGSMVNGGVEYFPVYYNKKYFAKLGIQPPTTPEELYTISEKIKADGKDPFVFGGKDGWPFRIFFDPYRNAEDFGSYPTYNDSLYKGEVKPSDLYKNTFAEFEKWVKAGYVGKASLTMSYDQSVQYFADGKAGMIPQGPWLTGLDPIKNAKDLELGAFAYPYAPVNGKIQVLAAADRSIGISAKTKHADAAKKLYNFFLEQANITEYLNSQGLTTLLPGLDLTIDPALVDFMKVVGDTGKIEPHFNAGSVSFPPAWDSVTWASYQNILAGQPVADELKRVDAEFAKIKDQAVK
ncbi:extracellular solute-binding protein [Cohnella ginsengisoli]|uniref:Extracellular solute-binding protein n=1 Tax=Cohnella ginsengisoli TaxID=425004 RepID=A0A9X4KMD2_9BACL|nr:extracellular solute-binding protein [Cohnella ginsengisoli]MDG0792180.1 extracellular solute-binding protein [Cohnella ginsengisoli]